VKTRRWLWLVLLLAVSTLVLGCAFAFDAPVERWVAQHQNHGAKIFMLNVTRFGDWPEHAVLGFLLIGLAYWRGYKKWTRIFLSMLIAFALAGATARIVKFAAGRARPSVKSEEVWNGPRWSDKYHAFPSGHTAASAAFFAVLFFANWRIGLACLPISILIGFSRIYLAAHYLSDVVFAGILGAICAALTAHFLLGRIANRKS
jgi:membrane-associated phospholipid phosphatase